MSPSATSARESPSPSSSPGIGIPSEKSFEGPWLSQQLLLTTSLGVIALLSFSVLVKRRSWRSYLAPLARVTGSSATADDNDLRLNYGQDTRLGRLLASTGLEWLAVTLYTSDIAVAHLSGPATSSIDALSLLKFFRFGVRLFAYMSLWSILVLMPVNWRQNGWLDGVEPSTDGGGRGKKGKGGGHAIAALASSLQFLTLGREEKKPVPILPGSPSTPLLAQTSLYDVVHIVTTFFFTSLLLYLLTTRTSALLTHHQQILHSIHSTVPARSVLIRSLPLRLRSAQSLRAFFDSKLEMDPKKAWVLPDVGSGLRKLLTEREKALRKLERAWVSWVGNPVKREMRHEWHPLLIEARMRERTQRILDGGLSLPERGWLIEDAAQGMDERISPHGRAEEGRSGSGVADLSAAPASETISRFEQMPDLQGDVSYGPPSFVASRPSRRVHIFSSRKVDLLADLEVEFIKIDAALALIRKKMLDGDWKTIPVGFVEFDGVRDALVASQTLFCDQPGFCKVTLAPDNRDIIWRNVGIPEPERRLRQMFVSIAITLLYLFYLPPLLFLGSLLSPGFLNKYVPGFYKLLSASPRLEALVSTSLPSLVLVAFNAGLPMLLEATAVWQGVKTKSGVELSVLKKYHIFLVTSVIFVFFITTTAFGVVLDLSSNPMAILDKLSLSLPQARNFSLSYVILQSLTILPLQLLSLPILLLSPVYVLAAKTPREHAEAHAAPVFKAGYVYPQALIVATLGMLYSIVKPQVTVFALIYFAIGYVVYKYKLLFVFYPPPSSSAGQSITIGVLRPRLIFAALLFQVFQLSLFSLHGNVVAVFLMLPLIATTLWYGSYLRKRFDRLERFEALEGALQADRKDQVGYSDGIGDASVPTSVLIETATEDPEAQRERQQMSGPPEWPKTTDEDEEHSQHDEHGHDDDPTSEWRAAQRGTVTGTSTPSEVASLAETPKKQAALSKRIWSPVARLKRGRSRRGTLPTNSSADASPSGDADEDEDEDEGRRAHLDSSSSQQRLRRRAGTRGSMSSERMFYHRPTSRFTNYREASAASNAVGVDTLPGLLERNRPGSRIGQDRRLSRDDDGGDGEDAPDGGEWDGLSGGDLSDEDEDLYEEAEEDTYEHPIIKGRLRQVWLPGAPNTRSAS
ncbi:unnamed protein product [Parajaminaea phylloscopi]